MLKETPNGIELAVKITPKASKNEIVGWESGELKIRIAAVPEKGEANEELIRFLAKQLGISKSQIILLSGDKNRHKRLIIKNYTLKDMKNSPLAKHCPSL